MMRSLTIPSEGPNVPQPSRMIPLPDVPVQPVLSFNLLAWRRKRSTPTVLDAGPAIYVTAGRVAIALALQAMGVSKGDKVLVPAFHCASMVEPLAWVGAEPTFYRVRDDLSVDLDDVAAKTDAATRVLLATHYFGFPQDLVTLRNFCDYQGLKLLEDCAHSFFGTYEGRPLGSYGDIAIASLTKFLPVPDGGCLISSRDNMENVRLHGQSVVENIKGLWDCLEDAVYYKRLSPIAPFLALAKTTRSIARSLRPAGAADRRGSANSINPAYATSGIPGKFDARWIDVRASAVTRAIGHMTAGAMNVDRRRHNYWALLEGLAGLTGCRPIKSTLPEGVVPYMFPLWIDDLDRLFPRLEDAAVPMLRFGQFLWPEMAEDECPISAALSRHLIQLPCHQNLTDDEIRWVIEQVRNIVGAGRGGT